MFFLDQITHAFVAAGKFFFFVEVEIQDIFRCDHGGVSLYIEVRDVVKSVSIITGVK